MGGHQLDPVIQHLQQAQLIDPGNGLTGCKESAFAVGQPEDCGLVTYRMRQQGYVAEPFSVGQCDRMNWQQADERNRRAAQKSPPNMPIPQQFTIPIRP